MKELVFKTSNEVLLLNVIKGIYSSGFKIINYTVDKVEDTTTFKLVQEDHKKPKVSTNKNEQRENKSSRLNR